MPELVVELAVELAAELGVELVPELVVELAVELVPELAVELVEELVHERGVELAVELLVHFNYALWRVTVRNTPTLLYDPLGMTIETRVASRWIRSSLSDNPEKWRGKTVEYQKTKGRYTKHRRLGEYEMHWYAYGDGYYDIYVTTEDDRVIASLFYGEGDYEGYLEGAIEVDPAYRRRGIATALYDWAERLDGREFRPADSHTQDAENFWQARRRRRRS